MLRKLWLSSEPFPKQAVVRMLPCSDPMYEFADRFAANNPPTLENDGPRMTTVGETFIFRLTRIAQGGDLTIYRPEEGSAGVTLKPRTE